jgi:hypothetical protein
MAFEPSDPKFWEQWKLSGKRDESDDEEDEDCEKARGGRLARVPHKALPRYP